MFPPIPGWEGLHPLIIHFPIALLIVAPLLVIIGVLIPRNGRAFIVSAFILMLIGTVGAFLAVSTGEAAGELAEHVNNVDAVLEQHEELAETTQIVFAGLTALFGVIVFAPMLFKKELSRKIVLPLNLAFLLFYGSGIVLLINTAHQGGRLVHEFGVQSMVASTTQADSGTTPAKSKKTHDDDD